MSTLDRRALGLAAALAVCGAGGCSHDGAPAGTRYGVWVKGVNGDGYSALVVSVKSLAVNAGGAALTTAMEKSARAMDLARADQAYLGGYFWVPDGVDAVEVSAQLDDFGGYERDDGAGAIDARSAPVRFRATRVELGQHGRAVVQLDLGRSLVRGRGDDVRLLLPNAVIAY